MRTAVIGTGNIARQHLAALRSLPDSSVAAVCDLSRAAAEATAERYGVEAWYTDHETLLDAVRPDIVHVTTPPHAHFQVALDALDRGAHVFVEKPAALTFDEVETLVRRARGRGRALVEDYNFLYNRPVRRLIELVESGEAGPVVHVDVTLCVDAGRSGTVAEYVSHLASLVHAFVGPHRSVSIARNEPQALRAVVDGGRGTAAVCFSARARPDMFVVRLHAERLRASASLFGPGLLVERERPGLSRPLVPLVNGLGQALAMAHSAVGGLWEKISGGPGSYEGLWQLVRFTHEAVSGGGDPPVSLERVLEVNRLVADLRDGRSP